MLTKVLQWWQHDITTYVRALQNLPFNIFLLKIFQFCWINDINLMLSFFAFIFISRPRTEIKIDVHSHWKNDFFFSISWKFSHLTLFSSRKSVAQPPLSGLEPKSIILELSFSHEQQKSQVYKNNPYFVKTLENSCNNEVPLEFLPRRLRCNLNFHAGG